MSRTSLTSTGSGGTMKDRDEKRTAVAFVSVSVKESATGEKTVVVNKASKVSKIKEKKVYNLPGQKHEPPNERDPLKVFYETLREQIPWSEMAESWLMEHGLLSAEYGQNAFEKKQGRSKVATPVKASAGKVRAELQGSSGAEEMAQTKEIAMAKAVSKVKRKLDNYSAGDDDFIENRKKDCEARAAGGCWWQSSSGR